MSVRSLLLTKFEEDESNQEKEKQQLEETFISHPG